ncbi:MAG: CaiB/BaiF CoA-transferase family protein [Microbacteriaceae bacterium]
MNTLPLNGITVVGLEQAVAAPFATRQLADLGARVIKVERDVGDFARGYDHTVHGMSSYFVWLNRGKESVVLDLKSPEDLAALDGILATADVFIQNLAPGAAARLGLGGAELLARHPRIIHTSISGYGDSGPYRDKKAYDLLIQCESGFLSVTGTPEHPAKAGISIADVSAGMYAFSGILTALYQRERTGKGEILEISMLDAMGEWMSQPYFYTEYGGSPPQRSGPQHASIAPYGPVDVLDGTVFLGIQNEREWASFCSSVLRKIELSTDERFLSNADRVANRAALHQEIDAVFSTLTSREALERLESAEIANAALRTMADFSAHPQLAARHRWRDVDSPHGSVRSLLPPINAASWEARMGAVPSLGQHTDAVLQEFANRAIPRSGTANEAVDKEE